ncbi:hypothetical protein Tco_0596722 [Tanacetum coccineum]
MHVQESIVEEEVGDSGITSMGNISFDELKEVLMTTVTPQVFGLHEIQAAYAHKDQDIEEADSDLEFMLGDEIESLSRFEADETDNDDTQSEHKEEFSKADEATTDNVANMFASTNKPSQSDPLGHRSTNFSLLVANITNLESFFSQKIADKIEESVPQIVADTLKERLLEMLSDTLKTILIDLLRYYVKKVLPKLDKRVKKTLKAQVPDLILKPLNKELNALNTLENNRTVDLRKKLTKVINTKVGESIQHRVRREVKVVKAFLKYYIMQLDKNDVNLRELFNMIRDLVVLIDTASASAKATPEGANLSTQENKDEEITIPATTQGRNNQ